MQGLADMLPYTIGDYLADDIRTGPISIDSKEFDEAENYVKGRIEKLMSIKGNQTVDSFHKRLGKIMWEECGMARNKEGLTQAIADIRALKDEFWSDVKIPGKADEFNQELEKAGGAFIELGELMCIDALEECMRHFREEYQTEGEALRNDKDYAYVAARDLRGREGA